jgi:ABC-type transport system substrate-binding protein
MKTKFMYLMLAVLVILSLSLAACQPKPAAVPAPAVEAPAAEAPAAEAPVAEEPAAELMVVTAPDCEYGGMIKEIAALDANTIQISMCVPDPAFESKAAFTAFSIQPQAWLEKAIPAGDHLSTMVGTGPYVIESWNRGDSIIYKKFDGYWGTPAIADTLVFRWATEGAARLLELQSGTVDGIDNPSPGDFETIRADSELVMYDREGMNIFYLAMTNTFEPFDNPMVRKAIAMGIDRARIVDTFYPIGSSVATHFTPCSIPNGCTGDDWYDFDPVAAKAMLAEAGYPDGFDTTIYYRDVFRGYLPEPGNVATDLQAQLRDNLGINAKVEVMESGAFIDESTSGRLDGLYLLGWGADYPHITNFLDYHFTATNPQFGTTHPEIYEPLMAAAQIADPDEAKPLYVEANNAIRELVPMIPIAHGGSATVFRADVKGAHASPLGNEYFAVVDPGGRDTLVWMQNAEPISIYCNDETDGESLRACEQTVESLLSYEVGGTEVNPGLATACEPNDDLTVWTCTLRDNVKFHDGSTLHANDVVFSWAIAWDAASPFHVGNTGAFDYFTYLWGNLINAE